MSLTPTSNVKTLTSTSLFTIGKYLLLAFVITISLLPFLWILLSALKTDLEIWESPFSWPQAIQWKNFALAFKAAPLALFFRNSVLIAIGSVALSLLVYSMAAYVLARQEFRFKKIILALIASCLLVPGTAFLFPVFFIVRAMHLYDTHLGLIFIYTAFGMPVSVYIIRSYFLTIPKELEESAYMDGAGFFTTFWHIMLPLATPALMTAGTLHFLFCWNEFQYALLLTQGNNVRTVPLSLRYFTSLYGSNFSAMFAAMAIVVIPSIAVFVILQNRIISGLTAGSVKE